MLKQNFGGKTKSFMVFLKKGYTVLLNIALTNEATVNF